MALHEEIQLLHPGAKPGVDYVLMDKGDGAGPFIKTWNLGGTKPTEQQLAAKKDAADVVRAEKVAALNRRSAYPSVGDQLGAICKVLAHLKSKGTDIGIEGDALLESIEAVKTLYPVAAKP